MPGFARKCPCLRPKIDEDIRVLDYKHSSLHDVPTEVFNKERTLEELYVDCNQIRDLPRELFFCHGLRKLSLSDNEITSIPPAISSLANLEELDFSKNGIIEVPDNIKGCKYLRSIDASVNPLGRLPEGFTFLANLTHLYLNDTFLDYLPGSIGRMVKLKILELRENHIKSLPRSFSRLVELERLDIGNNEFTELSDVIGGLRNLLELWCDSNQITTITRSIGKLKHLMYLDASNNQLQELPKEIEGCVSLADLHLSTNDLVELPDSIALKSSESVVLFRLNCCEVKKLRAQSECLCSLKSLITLKVDDNQLTYLPRTLGGLTLLSELNVSVNDLEEFPASIGLLRNLRTLYADENLLQFIPAEIGSCSGITVLSLRNNKLTYIPDELGRIPRLRVLNLSDNLLRYLPFSIIKLKELQALWLTENQTRPLIPLQSEHEPETGRKILTCYLLPQGELVGRDETDHAGDSESFHSSMWEEHRQQRQQIHFDFAEGSDEEGTLVRCPTPYPKELKQKVRHARSLALRQLINADNRSGINDDAGSDAGATDHNTRMAGTSDEDMLASWAMKEQIDATVSEGQPMDQVDIINALRELGRNKDLQSNALQSIEQKFGLKIGVKESGHSQGSDKSEVRMREGRSMRPASPRLQESHRLYRYDKEKLLKDKARMQHRLSVPEFDSGLNGLLKDVHNLNRNVKQREAILPCRSDSVPNLTSNAGRDLTLAAKGTKASTLSSPLTFSDIYYKQPVSQHKRRRSRRVREYNSDTDYRSDLELIQSRQEVRDDSSQGANSEILSVQSQPLPHLYYHHYKSNGRWRETTGCASDLETYSGGGGGSFPTANAAAAAFQKKYHQLLNHSSVQNISLAETHSRACTPDSSKNFRPNTVIKSESYKLDKRTSNDFHPHHSQISDFRRHTTNQGDYTQRVTRTRYHDVPEDTKNIQTNDEFHNHTSRSEYYPTFQRKIKSNPAINSHHSSSQTSSEPVHEKTSNTLKFQPELTSGPTMQFPRNSEFLQQKPALLAQNDISQSHSSSLSTKSRGSTVSASNLSLHRSYSPSSSPPVFHKDIVSHSTPVQYKTAPLVPSSSSLSFAAIKDYTGSKLSIVFEERAMSEKHLPTEESHVYGKLLVTPPPYHPAPPYVKSSDTTGSGRCTSRLSSDLAISHIDSPRSASPLAASSLNDNFIVNQSKSSPCGFHGHDPYSDLPTAVRQKLSFTDYEDSDHKRQNNSYTSGSYRSYRGTPTHNSDSNSSHIGSASQTGSIYPSGRGAVGRGRSNSFDSQSDVHNHSSSNESPQSGSVYCSSQPRSRQQSPPDQYSLSIDAGNYEELLTTTNQEQSSQVSSSSDSGYGHGQHVYEFIGDHFSSKGEKHSSIQGDPVPDKLNVTSASSSQRHPSIKGSGSVCSRDATPAKDLTKPDSITQEHKEQFRITIKKNPGLGFSIAGGIGSHGNPFREEDIGIFVTKVIPNGPASKFLRPGDKILEVNKVDFQVIEHNQAVAVLKKNNIVTLLMERAQKVNVV